MALDFPANPVNGQVYDSYYYDSSMGTWRAQGSGLALNVFTNPTITGGTISGLTSDLAVADGGTGASDPTNARINLGAAATSHQHSGADITSGSVAIANGGTGAATVDAARTNLGIGAANIYYGEAGVTGHQSSTTIADWNGPVSTSVVKKQSTTRLLLEATGFYSPQGVNADNQAIYIQINGIDYEIMQFSSGVQYNLRQISGAYSLSGLAAGTYTAKLRYKAIGSGQSLYTVSWAKSFIKITETI